MRIYACDAHKNNSQETKLRDHYNHHYKERDSHSQSWVSEQCIILQISNQFESRALHLLHYSVDAIDRVVVLDPSAHPSLHVQAVVVWIGIPYL